MHGTGSSDRLSGDFYIAAEYADVLHSSVATIIIGVTWIFRIAWMFGHSDAGFMLRTYTHVTRQTQESAAEKMGNFMAQVM